MLPCLNASYFFQVQEQKTYDGFVAISKQSAVSPGHVKPQDINLQYCRIIRHLHTLAQGKEVSAICILGCDVTVELFLFETPFFTLTDKQSYVVGLKSEAFGQCCQIW